MEEQHNIEHPVYPKKKQGLVISPRIGLAVLAVVLLAASFYSGVAYQKGKSPATTQAANSTTQTGQFGGEGGGFGGGGGQRGNRAIGTVSAISSSSITVTTRGGTAATYAITSSTTVTNGGSSASVSDIQTGDTVFIMLDTSNAKDAASIAVNPSFGGGGGQATPDSSSSTNSDTGTSTSANSI
jgi:hypothetical protein